MQLPVNRILVHRGEMFLQAEDGIRDLTVTGVQTCALPIYRMARRNHTHVITSQGIPQEGTDPDQVGLIAVFEYMIANTDWSVGGLHNIVLTEDTSGTVYPVPYDFDWSGVISTPYARPDARLNITSVRQRLFRGYCRPADQFAAIFARFNDRKDAIYTLYRSQVRSEERRVGKECRSRWSPY